MELVLLLSTCDPSSSIELSGSMRPILVTRVLKGLSAQPRMVPRSVRRHEGVARSVDRITSQ